MLNFEDQLFKFSKKMPLSGIAHKVYGFDTLVQFIF